MKNIFLIAILGFVALACSESQGKENKQKMSKTISKSEALEIANKDAIKVYADLSIYRIDIEHINDTWKVDYELIDTTLNGGGPHYIISDSSGEIVEKRYEQ